MVIPTFRRPELAVTAVRSALAQTLGDLEALVVVDGRDEETARVLGKIGDARLRVLLPEQHLGNAEARNWGVVRARGRYVAFLDDDDTWMPEKLARQLGAARSSRHALPIVACRLTARSEARDFTWPRREPRPGEDLSEYLFCRQSPFMGEGLITTSALFVPRELVTAVPFRRLPRYVDVDWLLRAGRHPGAGVEFVPDPAPLLVWHIAARWPRITDQRDWHHSLAWARANRDLFSRRGYAAFLLHAGSSDAAMTRAWGAFLPLMLEAVRRGRPAPVDLFSHLGNFFISRRVQRAVALGFERLRGRPDPRTEP